MPLNLPNLDDRSYKDLVQEALASLPANAPEWTNHNPSDPGITLIELLAYLTEMLIYRINRVTDKNYYVFLKLLKGPGWTPSPSKSLSEQIREAVLELREANRAVTCEDFERLARQADARVARAHCMPRRDLDAEAVSASAEEKPGHISVVLVPAADSTPQPDADLIQKVKAYLEPRRLLTTQVHVAGPRYYDRLRIQLTLVLKPDAQADAVKKAAEEALKQFYDPRTGGEQGEGWPFGRYVYVSEIYQLLDTLPGVDYVTRTVSAIGESLDELIAPAGRLLRRPQNNLVALKLLPDELIDPQAIRFALTMQSP